MSDDEARALEKRLIQLLERTEKAARPWTQPRWWASWAVVITAIVSAVTWVNGMALERKFSDFSQSRGLYAIEKRYAGKGIIDLAHESRQRDKEVADLVEKTDEILDRLRN